MTTTQTTNMKRFLMTSQLSLLEDQTSYHQVKTHLQAWFCDLKCIKYTFTSSWREPRLQDLHFEALMSLFVINFIFCLQMLRETN